jgi:hypothetical protein
MAFLCLKNLNTRIFVEPQDFTAFNSFLVMLEAHDLYFPHIDMTFHLNSIPRVSGSLGIAGSTAYVIYRLECGSINRTTNVMLTMNPIPN